MVVYAIEWIEKKLLVLFKIVYVYHYVHIIRMNNMVHIHYLTVLLVGLYETNVSYIAAYQNIEQI